MKPSEGPVDLSREKILQFQEILRKARLAMEPSGLSGLGGARRAE
jgi:hypothetical protein